MDINFKNNALQKLFSSEKELIRKYGDKNARLLMNRLTRLMAAENLMDIGPPMRKPERCHELGHNRKGELSIDLWGPYRLIFKPNHDPIPSRADGGLDWSQVTKIVIYGVDDTHG